MPTQPYVYHSVAKYHFLSKGGYRLFDEPRRPLEYRAAGSFATFTVNDYGWGEANLPFRSACGEYITLNKREVALATNKALARFQDQLGPKAELGSTLAMWRESVEMVVDRATQMRNAYKYLKKGQFRSFLKELGVPPKHKHKTMHRNLPAGAGGLWLEYWMGWAPLAGDLFSALDVLTTTLPAITIKGTAKSEANWVQPHLSGGYSRTADFVIVVKIQADVQITNPNIYLADRLGLLNPVYVLYDAMPWSWMFNWFANIEQMAQSIVPPQGIEYQKGFTTKWVSGEGTVQDDLGSYQIAATWEGYDMRRELKIPNYSFVFNFSGLSTTRAATAISLLLQQLRA